MDIWNESEEDQDRLRLVVDQQKATQIMHNIIWSSLGTRQPADVQHIDSVHVTIEPVEHIERPGQSSGVWGRESW